jgi:DNA processing protein
MSPAPPAAQSYPGVQCVPGAELSERTLARAGLTYLAEPGDPALGALIEICTPEEILAAIKADMLPGTGPGCGDSPASRAALGRALGRWRIRLSTLPSDAEITGACRGGIRLVCPEHSDWPGGLDQLGPGQPYALWLRGSADLNRSSQRSVSVVGSRAATGYGAHVAGEIAADLAERGWAVVSGGAYGIDAAAHRGALATQGITIAVLACGVDFPYPAGHAELFADIAARGLVISEWPPGRRPARMRFLVRNRVIAALSCGTVIVEAGERSGALNTARHAAELGKPLMAVPGPVTSAQSAGCHRIIREWGASCVTRAADITDLLSPLSATDAQAPPDAAPAGTAPGGTAPGGAWPGGAWPGGTAPGGTGSGGAAPAGGRGPARPSGPGPTSPAWDPALPYDDLDADTARVLDAFPARGGAGTSTIAVDAGVDLDTVLRCLGVLAGYGFIERGDDGWRLRRPG